MKFIEKVKNFDYKSLFKKKEREEAVWFAATKTNIHHFKAGMFWYDDNTFSYDLILGKPVRAIVIKVKYGRVIGLLPLERNVAFGDTASFMEKMPRSFEDGFYLKCMRKMPEKSDWNAMYLNREIINRSMSEAGWLPLSGAYWCWGGLFHVRPAAVYDFDTAEKSRLISDVSAKGRYLITLVIK